MPARDIPAVPPDTCVLEHEVFSRLGDISFRRSPSDGAAVMIAPFGDREASIPLHGLKREFAIDDESPDGRMLALITESLDFVTAIAPGDRLPDEVVSGGASWEPAARHVERAAARLKLHLLAWLDPEAARDAGRAGGGVMLDSDPALRGLVQSAFRQAAAELGLAAPEEAVALLETMAMELAYIEALRELLFGRARKLAERIDGLCRTAGRGDSVRRETLTQVQRLCVLALDQFRVRFDDIDAQTGEIIAMLRNAEGQVAFIRANRDYLYRSLRAWSTILAKWDELWGAADETVWHAVADTYQFLARRYLPASEWASFHALRQRGGGAKPPRVMAW